MYCLRFKSVVVISLFILTLYSGIDAQPNYSNPKGPYAKGEKNVTIINGYKVVCGERPPVNLKAISSSAYHSGKILVKLKEGTLTKSSDIINLNVDTGFVQVNNPALDVLNKRFGVTQFKSILYDLYQVDEKSKSLTEKHEAWGFHNWFELTLDPSVDVMDAVYAFDSEYLVETVEPVYKIVPIKSIDSQPFKLTKSSNFVPNDQHYYENQWSFKNIGQIINNISGESGIDIKAQEAWGLETGNSNVIVSIHDTGVQYNHPDLESNMWWKIGPDGTGTKPGSHGTHVAGTIAAVTHNEIGVAGIAGGSGTGDGVRLMSVEVPFDGSTTLTTRQGFVYAADNGSAISQNSWGYKEPYVYNTADLLGIDYFNSEGGGDALIGGGLVIFAAGNSNDDNNWYPAYYSGTLSVASHDNRGIRSAFSNYGTWIDITAPGTGIMSTDVNNNYSYKSGTSMACPHVSGVAALIVSHAYGMLTPDEVWNKLLDHSDDIYNLNPDHANLLGAGRLNAFKPLNTLFIYNISIKVVDSNYLPIDGIPVSIETETKYTTSVGEVSFSKHNGDYEYTINVDGYHSISGLIIVYKGDTQLNLVLLSENEDIPQIQGTDNVCKGSEIMYSINNSNEGMWNISGGEIIESDIEYFVAKWYADSTTGKVRYITIDDNGYQITYQKEVSIIPKIAMNQPTIYVKGDIPIIICTSPSIDNYKWFYNGHAMPFSDQYFRADNENYYGKFWVEIMTENQCPHTSRSINFESSSFNKSSRILIYPNPSFGFFTIKYKSSNLGKGILAIVDQYGKVIYQESIFKNDLTFEKVLDHLSVPKGIYLILIQIGNLSPDSQRLIIN